MLVKVQLVVNFESLESLAIIAIVKVRVDDILTGDISIFNGVTLDNELQESRVASRQWSCQTGSEREKFVIA